MNDYLPWIYLAIIILLLGLCFCYNMCDTAYSGANRLRLEREAEKGDKKAAAALKLVDDYDFTIATVLFGNDFINIFASSLASILGMYFLNEVMNSEEASLLSSAIFVVIILVFAEILPKAIAHRNPIASAKAFVWFMKVNSILFFPIVWPINFLAKKVASPLIERNETENDFASDDELEAMVDEIREEGIIDEEQKELLQNSIDFKDTSCYEIMTPRVKMFAYDLEDSFDEFVKQKGAFIHSRIPVCKGDLDHIVGYFQAKTLLRALVSGSHFSLEEMIHPIVSVPRTMEISSVLALMKKNKSHIVLIRDEFGGTEGIVTLEDILEELVGEMWDEEDKISDDIVKTEKRNVSIVRGEMNVSDFFDYYHLDDDRIEQDYSTVSGWITDKLGRFPVAGDKLRYEKIDLVVTKVENYHVISTTVTYHPRRKKFN